MPLSQRGSVFCPVWWCNVLAELGMECLMLMNAVSYHRSSTVGMMYVHGCRIIRSTAERCDVCGARNTSCRCKGVHVPVLQCIS
jgi:hypothetical protein